MWLRQVEDRKGERPNVDWRPFILAQANSKEGPDWKAWEQPPGKTNRGILALKAGMAAEQQGEKLYDVFHMNMLRARHEDRKDISDLEVIMTIAKNSDLNSDKLREDMEDPSIVESVVQSHMEAVEKYGVFGVPTLVFPNGQSAFVKMYYPSPEDSVEFYDGLAKLISTWVNIGEIKRPQPPWPAGVTPGS